MIARYLPARSFVGFAMRIDCRTRLFVICLCCFTAQLCAQDVGSLVLTKRLDYSEAKDRIEVGPDEIAHIISAKGDRLEVEVGRRHGWINRDDAVTVDDAVSYFTSEIRAHPKNTWNWIGRAAMYRRLKEYDKSIADWTTVLELNSLSESRFQTLDSRAYVYRLQGKTDLAINDHNEQIRLFPEHSEGYRGRGAVREVSGDWKGALTDYQMAMKVVPESSAPHYDLSRVYGLCPDQTLRDPEKAVFHGRIAVGLSRFNNPDSLTQLATIYAEQANFEKAVQYQSMAVSLSRGAERQVAEKMLEDFRARAPSQ